MTTNYEDAQAFNRKYTPDLVPEPYQPTLLSPELLKLRNRHFAEEVTEFHDACEAHDLIKAADALVDIVKVAMITADLMGLPWQAIWNAVCKANMTGKHRARYPEESKRHSVLDVVKSPHFVGPDEEIREALVRAGHAFAEEDDDIGTGDAPPVIPPPAFDTSSGSPYEPPAFISELAKLPASYETTNEDDGVE